MINVKRSDCPDILKISLTPLSSGEWETRDAIEYYQDIANHAEKYKKLEPMEQESSRGIRFIQIKV